MNKKFPYYLKKFKSRKSHSTNTENETFMDCRKAIIYRDNNLPSLKEYVEPFQKVGFEILKKDIFCWIPHSSGKLRFTLTKTLAPLADKLIPNCAMRVLVIAKKPLE